MTRALLFVLALLLTSCASHQPSRSCQRAASIISNGNAATELEVLRRCEGEQR